LEKPKRIVIVLDPDYPDLEEEVARFQGHLSSLLAPEAVDHVEVQSGQPGYTAPELIRYFSDGK
jgi:hypothetical protein